MSNQVAVAERLPIGEVMSLAKAFHESGMFQDIKSLAQAVVKIQAGQEIGIPPFMAMSGLHIIKGKTTIGSGIMAAKIKASDKYNYKVLAKTDKVCKIEFSEDGESQGIEEFTIEDARRAETQNMHRHPKSMLFARCISNGQKTFCPDVFLGSVYVHEDFGKEGDEITDDVSAEVTTTSPEAIPASGASIWAPQPEDIRPVLDAFHGSYAAVVDAIKNKGYKVADVERKYRLSDEDRKTLQALEGNTVSPSSENIGEVRSQQNVQPKNETPITPAIPVAEPAPKSKRPF